MDLATSHLGCIPLGQRQDLTRKAEDPVRSVREWQKVRHFQSVGRAGSETAGTHHPMPDHCGVPVGLHNSLPAAPSSALLASTIEGQEVSAAHKKLDNSCMVHVLTSHGVIRRPDRKLMQQVQENYFKADKQRDEAGLLDHRPGVAHASVQIDHLAVPLITDRDDLQRGRVDLHVQPNRGDSRLHCAEFWSVIHCRRFEYPYYFGMSLLEVSLIFPLLLLLLLLVLLLLLLPRKSQSALCGRTWSVNLRHPFHKISSPERS